jgi:hypothetical protein
MKGSSAGVQWPKGKERLRRGGLNEGADPAPRIVITLPSDHVALDR